MFNTNKKRFGKLKLISLENTFVNTTSLEEFQEIIKINKSSALPGKKFPEKIYWRAYGPNTCVEVGERNLNSNNPFYFLDIDECTKREHKIITKGEYYKIQKITSRKIKSL